MPHFGFYPRANGINKSNFNTYKFIVMKQLVAKKSETGIARIPTAIPEQSCYHTGDSFSIPQCNLLAFDDIHALFKAIEHIHAFPYLPPEYFPVE